VLFEILYVSILLDAVADRIQVEIEGIVTKVGFCKTSSGVADYESMY